LILCNGNLITAEDIFIPEDDMPGALDDMDLDLEGHSVLGEDLRKREFELILETLRSVNGSKKHTAEKLGISPRTLRYKLARMRESGIDVERICA
ncbi:MAG: helix-turn-helix domain-containing protein, partial [Pseudomonadota bacterium]